MEASAWGLLLLVIVADVWALRRILARTGRPLGKAIWVASVLLLPLLGVAAWLLVGPATLPLTARRGRAAHGEE